MKNFYKIKTKSKIGEAGFTIVETLVAISILTIALTGPLAIVAQSLRASFYSRDQVTAYYLAQEAIEYIRNTRDNNSLQEIRTHTDWLETIGEIGGVDRINNPGAETNKLYLEKSGNYQLKACNSVCPNMRYADPSVPTNSSKLPYGEDDPGLPLSKFTREIVLNRGLADVSDPGNIDLAKNREVVVTVRVKWTTPSGEKNVVIRENLFNWQIENFEVI
jgi:type II secretory pathway pseudopilin PulG